MLLEEFSEKHGVAWNPYETPFGAEQREHPTQASTSTLTFGTVTNRLTKPVTVIARVRLPRAVEGYSSPCA